MHTQIVRGLGIRHASIFNQPHRFKLELSRKLPPLHDSYVDGSQPTRPLEIALIGSLAIICPASVAAAPWPRAKMVSAMRVPNTSATYNGQWVIRDVSRLRSIDHAISSLSCKVLHQLSA